MQKRELKNPNEKNPKYKYMKLQIHFLNPDQNHTFFGHIIQNPDTKNIPFSIRDEWFNRYQKKLESYI